jgi:hypothetical protein
MRISKSPLTGLIALVLAFAPVALAQVDETEQGTAQNGGTQKTASGVVVSSSPTSLVIRTDAGTAMTFTVDGSSDLPTAVAAGDRVTVRYEGSLDPFRAMEVSLVPRSLPSAPGSTSPAAREPYETLGESPPAQGTERASGSSELPRTASPLPGAGLLGFMVLGAGLLLKAFRRHASHA